MGAQHDVDAAFLQLGVEIVETPPGLGIGDAGSEVGGDDVRVVRIGTGTGPGIVLVVELQTFVGVQGHDIAFGDPIHAGPQHVMPTHAVDASIRQGCGEIPGGLVIGIKCDHIDAPASKHASLLVYEILRLHMQSRKRRGGRFAMVRGCGVDVICVIPLLAPHRPQTHIERATIDRQARDGDASGLSQVLRINVHAPLAGADIQRVLIRPHVVPCEGRYIASKRAAGRRRYDFGILGEDAGWPGQGDESSQDQQKKQGAMTHGAISFRL